MKVISAFGKNIESFIRDRFTPPVFPEDEDKTRDAKILSELLESFLFILFLAWIGNIFVFVNKLAASIFLFILLALEISTRILLKRGNVRTASKLFVIGFWIILVVLYFLTGTTTSAANLLLISATVMAGMLLGTRYAILTAVLTGMVGLGMTLLEINGYPLVHYFSFPPMSDWIFWMLAFVLMIAPINLAIQGSTETLARSRQSEKRYKALYDDAPVMYLTIMGSGQSAIILNCNQTFLDSLGYQRDEVIGRWLGDFYTPASQEALLERNIFQQDVQGLTSFLVERTLVAKDGHLLHTLLRAIPEIDETGQMIGTMYVFLDITERKEAEEALRESEERLQLVMEGSQLGYWDWNIAAGVVKRNALWAEMLGYTLQEIEFSVKQWTDLHHPDDREAAWKSIQDHLGGKTPAHRAEYRMLTKDGEYKWILDQAKVVKRDSQGRPLRMSGTHTDITERKRAEEKLREAEHKYRLLVEQSPGVVYIDEIGDHWRYLSPQVEKLLGITAEKLISDYGMYNRRIHPDDIERVFAEMWEGIRRKQRIILEYQLLNSSDHYIWVRDEADAEIDPATGRIFMKGVIYDITERKQAEQNLRASEEKYRSLLASLDSIVASVDENGRFLYLNDVAAQLMGAPAQNLVGQTMTELFPDPINDQQLDNIRQVIYEDRAMVKEIPMLVQGQPHWYRTTIQPVHDHTGKVVHALINSTDIHNLKMAEDAVRQQLDAEKVVAEISQQFVNIKIENRAEIIQNALASLGQQVGVDRCYIFSYYAARNEFSLTYEWRASSIEPSDSAGQYFGVQDHPLLLQPIIRGEMLNIPRVADLPDQDPGCAMIKAQGISSLLCLPLTSEQGLVGLIGFDSIAQEHPWQESDIHLLNIVGRIITDGLQQLQQKQEILALNQSLEQRVRERTEALRQSQASLQAVLDTASDIIQSLDENGHYVYVNQAWCETLGYSAEEALQLSMLQVIDPTYHAHCQRILNELFITGKPQVLEVVFLTRDGRPVMVEGSVNVRQEMDGQRLTNGFFRDVTLRKQAEQAILESEANLRSSRDQLSAANAALEKAALMKDEFLASMSHELRTPLTGILGLSEALQFNVYGALTQKQARAMKNIEESGQHLLNLINDILDLSKIEAGMLDLNIEVVSLADICRASLQLTRGMAHKKQQSVEFSIEPKTIRARADARRLKQILVNLLSNAIKFTPPNGKLGLIVELDEPHQQVRIIVWDQGIGIKPENLPKLFQAFTQIDSSLAREYAGTGLGLALVKQLVDLHQGSVEVESVFGVGSQFTVILPWIPQTTPTDASREHQGEIQSDSVDTSSAGLILIADDNLLLIEIMTDYLESHNYRVVKAYNGKEVLENIGSIHPDLVLMDIQMPGMDGLETIRCIRNHADPVVAATHIIAVTALAMSGDRERCLTAGANNYLSKPVQLKQLAEIIKKLLVNGEDIK